jgi:two-component system chemotaxis sensor kinase CheA
MDEMEEVVKEFLVESAEGLDQLDRDLVTLEQHPGDQELLARIFRCIHTIKGTGGFLGFAKLESVTHVGESLLALLRSARLPLTPMRTSGLLLLVDATRQMLASIEANGTEGEVDYTELVAWLSSLQNAEPGAAGAPGPLNLGDLLVAGGLAGEARVQADTSIRVDVGLLDQLMSLVGELGLLRSQILQHVSASTEPTLVATSQRLDLITTELQETVLRTRLQPIGNLWSKLPRVVRDLALACDKQVRLEMDGEETELDKTIIEAIKDPLTHIVRNSVDHGFELPSVRIAAGKPPEGRLAMRAFHEGTKVTIEISDDGAGIDPDKLRASAVKQGLLSAEQAARLSDREAVDLIFAAGFTTAEKITSVSGRGVGMDVVRTNIRKIGGSVNVHSARGRGTTLEIRIPLSAIRDPATRR